MSSNATTSAPPDLDARVGADAAVDLVSLGRANLDLYAQDIGADFADITGFDAMVGGSPTNIAIGAARLGITTSLLSAVGTDRVGDFVLRYLNDEGVDTSHVSRIDGKLTSLALLGVKPPSDFPLSFYREDPADIYLRPADVEAFPLDRTRMIQISGNALSRGACAEAAVHAASEAARLNVTTTLDLDLRPTEWAKPGDFGVAVRTIAPSLDVVIGTEEEFHAALMHESDTPLSHDPIPNNELSSLNGAIAELTENGATTAVVKRGKEGATIVQRGQSLDVAGYPAQVVNTVGAGDAFAAGLLRSRLVGLDWPDAVRFANACGALVVTRHGCSSAMPTESEVEAVLAAHT
ncbi:MAG: 5-dehydro-2-deoxygluconokinase [Acidimicrobiia bacterium]